MTAKIRGMESVFLSLDTLKASALSKLQDACFVSAEQVRSRTVISINKQKPNPEAKPGRRGHIPGPPGGPPNADTGNLSARYTTTTTATPQAVQASVVAGVHYAWLQEKGSSKMPARPHLIPQHTAERPRFQNRVKVAVKAAADEARKKGAAKK